MVDVGTLMRLKDRDAGLERKAEWKPPRAGKPALSIGGGRRGAAGGQVRMRARPRASAGGPPRPGPGPRAPGPGPRPWLSARGHLDLPGQAPVWLRCAICLTGGTSWQHQRLETTSRVTREQTQLAQHWQVKGSTEDYTFLAGCPGGYPVVCRRSDQL